MQLPVEFLFPPIIVSGIRAREELWDRLCSGDLIAEGKRHGKSERIPITAADWKTLDWLDDPSAPANTVGSRTDNVYKYNDVSLSGQKFREIWPPFDECEAEEYDREDWSVDHAILWITYRNPALFHFVGFDNPRVKAQLSRVSRQNSAPKRTILQALMTDKLRAIRNGEQIQPAQWFGKRIPRNQPEEKRIYFRRSDILREWPEPEENFSNTARAQRRVYQPQNARKRGKKPSKSLAVLAAMRDDIDRGTDIGNMKEEVMASKYDASRDTCRKVRNKLLDESVEK